MTHDPRRPEVDRRMLKLLVGAIAMLLPLLVQLYALPQWLESISASYWFGFWPQTFFIGFLFAISGFLLSYDGQTTPERVASKVAAVAALLIALYPCKCQGNPEMIRGLHYAAAIAMYLVLAFFCWKFRKRALGKLIRGEDSRGGRRAVVYTICGIALLVAIAALAVHAVVPSIAGGWVNFVFVWEAVGLEAFGISWLTASHFVPWFNEPRQRFAPTALRYVPDPEAPAPAG